MQLRQSLEKIGDGVLHNIVGTDDVADAGTRSRPVRGGTVDRSHQLASDIRVGVPELQHEQDLRAPLWKLVASYDGVPPYIRLSPKVRFEAHAEVLQNALPERDQDAALAAVDDSTLDALVIEQQQRSGRRPCMYSEAGLDEAIFPRSSRGDSVEATSSHRRCQNCEGEA